MLKIKKIEMVFEILNYGILLINLYYKLLIMTLSAKYFSPLPEAMLDNIFAFANDGPKKLVFDAKKNAFVEKINKNFTLLKKAIQFKIDNPPYWDVDDPNFDYEIGTTELDIIENLTFKYPLKLRIRNGFQDAIHTNEGYLELRFSFSKSFNDYRTNNCTISLPLYYLLNATKAAAHYKNQCKKKLSKKDFYHSKYMYEGFKTLSYAPDVVFV